MPAALVQQPGCNAQLRRMPCPNAGWAGCLPPEVVEQRKQQMLRLIELPPEQFAHEFIPTLLTASAPAELVKVTDHAPGLLETQRQPGRNL